MIIVVPKIGNGTEFNPFRPDIVAKNWVVIEDRDNEFLIEIWD